MAKPYMGWYGWDEAQNKTNAVGWLGCHYNLTNGNVHSHCSIETLDNSSGSPTINTHFEISYNGSQTRANVKFPSSDVQFISDQKCYFGDTKQAWIMHNSSTGDLELNANADLKWMGTQIDANNKNIVNVADIFSTGDNIDLKSDYGVRVYPNGQTSVGLNISGDATTIKLMALGSNNITFVDNLNMNSYNITNAYLSLSTSRPVAEEGITYYNNSAGYHCLMWYNSTHWTCGLNWV